MRFSNSTEFTCSHTVNTLFFSHTTEACPSCSRILSHTQSATFVPRTSNAQQLCPDPLIAHPMSPSTKLAQMLENVGSTNQSLTKRLFSKLQLREYVAHIKHEARSKGYITTIAGRRRPIRFPSSHDPAQSRKAAAEADRKAVNSTIQGSAADLIKLAMCRWVHRPPAKQPQGMVALAKQLVDISYRLLTVPSTVV